MPFVRHTNHWRQFCSAVTLMACFGAVALAQEDRISGPQEGWHFRYDLFQMLLEERNLQIAATIDEALKSPEQSVIAIVGDTASLASATDWEKLVQFVENGGGLLLASDRSFLGRGFGRFWKGPVATINPRDQYQGFSDCLRITPTAAAAETLPGVTRIVTNRSGWFVPNSIRLNWQILAAFPPDCGPLAAQNRPLLAIGRSGGESSGLVVVCADPSVFSNGMLWHGDNAINAIRTSELLCGTSRTQMVFIADGQFQDTYRSQLFPATEVNQTPPADVELPAPESADALQLANAILKEIADSNVLNEALRQQPRNMRPAEYYRAVLVAVAILFVLGTIWVLAASGTLRSVFPLRRRMRAAYELRESSAGGTGDYRNPAGFLARELCLQLTGSRHSTDWQKLPDALAAGSSSSKNAARQRLARIVDIACRGYQSTLTKGEFKAFGKEINTLRRKYRESLPTT